MKKLSGVMPAVTTPFRSNGVIDHDMMIARCRHLFSTGCDGINLLGTTGEGSSVSISERISLMEEISTAGMEISNFMVSTGTPALGDTLKLTHKAVELGFRNLLVLPPYYFKNLDDDGMADYFSELVKVAKPADAKIFLYHIPAFTGFAFTPDFANRLRAEHGDVVAGIKDSTGDLAVSDAFVKQVPGFAVFPSAESSLAVARERGYAGCISATVNATAPFAAEVWRAGKYAAEALEAATSIRTAILGPSQVAAVKWAVAKLSGNESWARVLPPLRALKSERAAEIEQALDKYASLRAQL